MKNCREKSFFWPWVAVHNPKFRGDPGLCIRLIKCFTLSCLNQLIRRRYCLPLGEKSSTLYVVLFSHFLPRG